MVILPVEFERLVVALLVGMLIGLDRERAETRKAQKVFAGVRTFPLIALAGALPMVVLEHTGPLLVVASFFAVAAVVVAAYVRTSVGGDVGATTEIAALVTFLLGKGGVKIYARAAVPYQQFLESLRRNSLLRDGKILRLMSSQIDRVLLILPFIFPAHLVPGEGPCLTKCQINGQFVTDIGVDGDLASCHWQKQYRLNLVAWEVNARAGLIGNPTWHRIC